MGKQVAHKSTEKNKRKEDINSKIKRTLKRTQRNQKNERTYKFDLLAFSVFILITRDCTRQGNKFFWYKL